MTTPCSNTQQLSGPFNQTLFLGCTVINMDMNLGWGAETSSCRLTLVKDLYEHHNSPSMLAYKNLINNRFQNPNLNNENINNNENADLPYHQNIISKEKEKWDKVRNNDIDNMGDASKDIGKHCWRTYRSNIRKKYDDPDNPALVRFTARDPGFIGDYVNNNASVDIDIIGCPAFFRFADVWFAGMIKNWKFNSNKYEVELNSFSSLLKGCQLILQKYYGTISTVINNTSTALSTGQNLAVPYLDVAYPCGENIACRNNSTWPKYENRYNGSIYQGNIPNIFNVFGYLENFGFGSSGYVENRGVSAGRLYDAIVDMLGPKSDRRNNENVFNPYGAIVGKTPFDRTGSSLINPHSIIYTDNATGQSLSLTEMGLIYAPTAVDNLPRSLFALDISRVPRPPNTIYLSENNMDIGSFIDFCCNNAGVDYLIDFLPSDIDNNNTYSGTITINIVSRRVQPKPNTIRSFILNSINQQNIVSYNFGEEYQDAKTRSILIGGSQERLHQITTHTGGQMGWWNIFEPSLNSWVPISNYANDLTQNNSPYNTYRMPDHANQRPIENGNQPYITLPGVGAGVAQENANFYVAESSVYGGSNINRGSYLRTIKPVLNTNITFPGNSYPLYLDLISPYFGKNINNEHRRVYLDKKTGQLQIVIDFRDIEEFFPTPYTMTSNGVWESMSQRAQNLFPGISTINPGDTPGGSVAFGKFVVEEDELRAAMNAQSTWEHHRIVCINFGRPTAISKIIYNYLVRAVSPSFADAHIGLQSNNKAAYQAYLNTIDRFYSSNISWFKNGFVPTASQILRPELNMSQYGATMPIIQKLFTDIWGFLRDIANDHYGKTFAVRLPQLKRYAQNDAGEPLFNYSIVSDAWEEPGNTIDDTMETNSLAALILKSENGKIPPLLAFDNSAEYEIPATIYNNVYRNNNGNLQSSPINPNAHRDESLSDISTDMPINVKFGRYYFPLEHQIPSNSFVMLPYMSLLSSSTGGRIAYSTIPNTTTAHNLSRRADLHLYKMYTKAQIMSIEDNSSNPQIISENNMPRVVLTTPSPVFVKSVFSFGLSSILAENFIGDEEPAEVNVINFPLPRRSPDAFNIFLLNMLFDTGLVNKFNGENIGPSLNLRAAKPVFAAVPLRYNLATYGPWVSHPGLISSIIFPGQASNADGLAALVNNLVGGVNLEIDSSLVPWEYGSMQALDAAALLRAEQNNEYQQVLETGDLTLAGIMLENWTLGSYLLNDLGPIITGIKINIGDNGMTTSYSLRSFSRKIGFYNKEQADNIKNNNNAIILQNKRISNTIKDILKKLSNN
jgi:hypothetical protein